MLDTIILSTVNEFIKSKIKKEEIRNFLLNHERKQKFIDNMIFEIKKVELSGTYLDRPRIEKLSIDMARLFCKTALESKRQELLTYGGKIHERIKFENMKEEDDIANEMAGVVDVPKRTKLFHFNREKLNRRK